MRCPFCQNPETKVVDSRTSEASDAIRRRRECDSCKRRFTTYERLEEIPLVVIKRNRERELFEPSKLLNGLLRACEKRQVPLETLEQVVSDIEVELRNQFKYEVNSKKIGEMALRRLREIDKVAYVRFASVYRHFDDVNEFNEELKKLQESFDQDSRN
jgi:transcriptional repressor NrdR